MTTQHLLMAIILLLIFRLFYIESMLNRIKANQTIETLKVYGALYSTFFHQCVNLFETEVLLPPPDYEGSRNKLIKKLFFDLVPDAEGKLIVSDDFFEDEMIEKSDVEPIS